MSFLFRGSRETLRRKSVPLFIKSMVAQHPELARPVLWTDFIAMCDRESITLQIIPLHRAGRLLRIGERAYIQINEVLDRTRRTQIGMHELCHFWRDDTGEMCYHADEEGSSTPREQFADIFAWTVTSTAREFVPGLREEDLRGPGLSPVAKGVLREMRRTQGGGV